MSGETLYGLYRGDTFLDVGTAEELAERHGLRPDTIRTISTPSFIRRHDRAGSRRKYACRLEEDDGDETQ